MFGQNNNQTTAQDAAAIPDQAIDGVIASATPAAEPVANTTDWQHPGTPIAEPATTAPAVDTATPSTPAPSVTPTDDAHQLIDIKQQALSQLSPLVGHLDQTPEEKFRTTMMMIQATDDQTLIKTAYEAAGQITDEKAKAQALLDIVNEINYFTQQHQQ